eukprot:g56703.t1
MSAGLDMATVVLHLLLGLLLVVGLCLHLWKRRVFPLNGRAPLSVACIFTVLGGYI